jgi:hypothetical protein
MVSPQQSARLQVTRQASEPIYRTSDHADLAGRLIQIVLALYLLPALLVALAVGGVGMVILAVGRHLAGPIQRSAGQSGL